LATGCGDLSVLLEKKLAMRSLNDGEFCAAEEAGGGAELCGAAGGEAAAGAGADVAATGVPILLLPVQPAIADAAKRTATEAHLLKLIGRLLRGIPNPSLSASPICSADSAPPAMPRILYQANRGHPKATFCAETELG
jgi:hypothetical protein